MTPQQLERVIRISINLQNQPQEDPTLDQNLLNLNQIFQRKAPNALFNYQSAEENINEHARPIQYLIMKISRSNNKKHQSMDGECTMLIKKHLFLKKLSKKLMFNLPITLAKLYTTNPR